MMRLLTYLLFALTAASATAVDVPWPARTLLPFLPRWTTPDPLAEQAQWDSPYAYCAANPIANIDPTGESLRIIGSEEDVELTHSIYKDLLKDFGDVTTDDNGYVYFDANIESGTFPMHIRALNDIINSDFTTSINVVNNDPNIYIGSAPLSTIDIGDIMAFGATEPCSYKSILLHETFEQSKIQLHGLQDFSNQTVVGNHLYSHNNAVSLEQFYTGYEFLNREQADFIPLDLAQQVFRKSFVNANTGVCGFVSALFRNGNVQNVMRVFFNTSK